MRQLSSAVLSCPAWVAHSRQDQRGLVLITGTVQGDGGLGLGDAVREVSLFTAAGKQMPSPVAKGLRAKGVVLGLCVPSGWKDVECAPRRARIELGTSQLATTLFFVFRLPSWSTELRCGPCRLADLTPPAGPFEKFLR